MKDPSVSTVCFQHWSTADTWTKAYRKRIDTAFPKCFYTSMCFKSAAFYLHLLSPGFSSEQDPDCVFFPLYTGHSRLQLFILFQLNCDFFFFFFSRLYSGSLHDGYKEQRKKRMLHELIIMFSNFVLISFCNESWYSFCFKHQSAVCVELRYTSFTVLKDTG